MAPNRSSTIALWAFSDGCFVCVGRCLWWKTMYSWICTLGVVMVLTITPAETSGSIKRGDHKTRMELGSTSDFGAS